MSDPVSGGAGIPTQRVEAVAEAIRNRMPKAAWVHLSLRDYRALAEAAVAALNLTEERRTLANGWVQSFYAAPYYAAGIEPPPAVMENEVRLVGPWRKEEQ